MKKCLMTCMLMILISFSVFVGPSEKMAQYSFNSTDESVISSVDTIANSNVITESIQTIIKKWQIEFLIPLIKSTHVLRGKSTPFKFIYHGFLSREVVGFICAVQHQSNYLP